MYTVAIVGGCTVAGAVALPVVLPLVGFTSVGVAAASIAAGIQGPAVAAGSYFAIAQSVAATGTAVAAGAKIGVAVGVVADVACKAWFCL